MSNVLEYTLSLKDLISSKLQKIGITNEAMLEKFSKLEKQSNEVSKSFKILGTSVTTLKQKIDLFSYVALIKSCYLKKPARKALSYAAVSAQTDPLKYNEVILNDCWLAGDEEIKTDNGLFLSVSQKLPLLIEIKEAELVKL